MAQKTYQKLNAENLIAACSIWAELKTQKTISHSTFENIYAKARRIGWRNGSFHTRYQTTLQFLIDHDLITPMVVNGLKIYVATQKCFRSHTFNNATREVQVVSNKDIDKAINYVEINNGRIDLKVEAEIVADILKLEGQHKKLYIQYYVEYGVDIPYYIGIKFKVINPLSYLEASKMVKKI